MQAFRDAVEAADHEAMERLLAENVVFRSPVAFKPYSGRPVTAGILRAVFRVFEGFRYVRQIDDGDDHVLVFEAEINGRSVNGCDILHTNADGLIEEFTVMVRPLSAANALAERMATEFALEMERMNTSAQ
ncbi:nuclear transport factor 2 family protein [Williamsia herbipolensis]|uniref:Nuclear transport factor 2 family protein n=1 Tax=Williamsia herbipolensis TaxID=1603258 RepID=A0AAU4K1P8_9NOCA|nr:nuclear transport factor 2 family protein [Williamsia herbipolensis]